MKTLHKYIAFFSCLFFATAVANAQYFHYNGTCTQGAVKAQISGLPSSNSLVSAIPSCLVTVYATGTTNLAVLYADQGGTPLGNPFTAPQNSLYSFYVATGYYDIQNSGTGMQTTTLQDVGIGPVGGGGGGGLNPGVQNQVVFYPTTGTTGGPTNVQVDANTGNFLTAPNTNGYFNTDRYVAGSGNNGLFNLEAGACSTGGCTAMFPANSTSGESPVPTVTNTHVQDYRGGSQADFFYNANSHGAGGYTPTGDNPSAAESLAASWDASTITHYGSQKQLGENYNLNFNAPGWNWGSNPASTISNWSTQFAKVFTMTVSTPGIAELMGSQFTKYAVGDSVGAGYFYSHPDGGWQDPAGEGSVGLGLQVLQNSTWFIGRVGTGATTGTQSLPTTWTNTTNSRPQYSVGGYMIDLSQPILSNAHVTGPSVEVGSLYAWAFPVDATVTESTAWGTANADIPQPTTPGVEQSDTVNFTVIGGTNAGGYTTGKARMNGQELQEQVTITAVGAISGGVQSVTFTHRYPNTATHTSLWQGGTHGFYDSFIDYTLYNGWTTAYTVIGATDSSHLVGRFAMAGSNTPIPSFYNSSTANVVVANLSISGTTVTASFAGSAGFLFNHLPQITISGATNSSFNGTGSNVVMLNNNTLQWTQTGPSGTSTSANISYPQTYFTFNLFPGAQVTQPTLTTTVPLEPNDVPWTANDIIYNVFYPAYRGALITANNVVNSPDSSQLPSGAIGAFGASMQGAGISGSYVYLGYNNLNSPTMYQSAGGSLLPPTAISLKGPVGTVLNVQNAPLNQNPVINVGPPTEGAASTNDVRLITTGGTPGGMFNYNPAANYFFLTNLQTISLISPILSTGDGRYSNGNITGGAPVAMTAASGVSGNFMPSLGTYGAFGNGTIMDTSATMAAKVFAAGTVIAGALPPGTPVITTDLSGSTGYSYVCTANTQNGESLPSVTGSTTQGNAVLSSSHPNTVRCPVGVGAQSTNVYRSAVTGSYGIGQICANVPNNTIDSSSVAGCQDIGQAAGAAIPTQDTTGKVQSTSGVFTTSLTVAGQNVCQANGTNCPAAATLPVGSLTTTAAASDNLTVTGMTASGHCSLTATNTSAATNIATTYISAKTTNQITVTHTATAGLTYDAVCTPY